MGARLTEMCGKVLENYIVVRRCHQVLLVITKLLYRNYGIDCVKNKMKMNIQRVIYTSWEDLWVKVMNRGHLLEIQWLHDKTQEAEINFSTRDS